MRKLIISLLLVSTAAMPALAQDRDGGRRDRGQSSQSNDGDRAERRAARTERAETRRAERAERRERPQRVERAQRSTSEPARERRVERRVQRDDTPSVATTETPRRVRVIRPVDNDTRRTQTRRDRRGDDSLARHVIDMRDARRAGAVEVRRDRDRDQTRRRDRDNDRRWSSHWRSDNRYDWRRHRDRNRSIFRFGRYYDPYRYGYRRFSIGFNLWPSYYSSNFWLNDPWQYRLPPAYGPYRWVRYYDDALLVNIYTGQVVDVIHSFFW